MQPCPEIEVNQFEDSAWCTVQLEHSDKLLIGVCYRSPNSCEENNNNLLELIRTMNNAVKASHVFIMGDYNCRDINRNELEIESPESSFIC